ncbi:hypothetical protein [Devosia sp. 1566]|uniref:hypothetical protein n=1 Tax=Devosia sp. 1566 TaxID=2499144 RepID=UPI000FD8F985|nr:hypothetical protein [Devosia sp. 1566]
MARLLEQLRHRWRLLRLVEAGLYALAFGFAVFTCSAWTLTAGNPGAAIALGLGAGLLGFAIFAAIITAKAPAPVRLAMVTDDRYALAEKLASALEVVPGPQAGPVGEALLLDAGQAAERADPAQVAPWFTKRMGWAMAAPLLAVTLALAVHWLGAVPVAGDRERLSVPAQAQVSGSDIAAAAELIAADAERRDDPELAAVAAEMQALADGLDEAGPDAAEIGELAEQLDRAGNRYGNPLHDWPPFEGDETGLADRMAAARSAGADNNAGNPGAGAGGNGGAGQPGGETAEPEGDAAQVKPSTLPASGDEGEGLGIAPPSNEQQSSGMGEEEGFDDSAPQPSAQGAAEGAGEAESNMAGTGEGPAANASAPSLPPPAGFAESQTLAARTTIDAERVRSSETTEARQSRVNDTVAQQQWPRQDAMPVVRQAVPPSAAPAVKRLFSRDEQIAP